MRHRLGVERGLRVGRGIVVDDAMRTSAEGVYAIGDCAEHRGTVYGLVGPAWEQAAVVAEFDGDTEALKLLVAAARDGGFAHVAQRLRDARDEAAARAATEQEEVTTGHD